MTRKECLEKAIEILYGDRAEDYGPLETNFKTIADLWTAYKGVEFTTTDVTMMMALLKVARIKNGSGTEDSFVDIAGYAACGVELKKVEALKQENEAFKAKLPNYVPIWPCNCPEC